MPSIRLTAQQIVQRRGARSKASAAKRWIEHALAIGFRKPAEFAWRRDKAKQYAFESAQLAFLAHPELRHTNEYIELGEACDDCIMAIANDDYSGMSDEQEQATKQGQGTISKKKAGPPMSNLRGHYSHIYVQQVQRSRTGSTRHVKLLAVSSESSGRLQDVTQALAKACGLSYDRKRETVGVRGHGFSVFTHLIPYIEDATGVRPERLE